MSLYTVPLSAANGLSRLTTTSNEQARPIQKFTNRIGTTDSNSNRISKLRRSLYINEVSMLCHTHIDDRSDCIEVQP